MEKKRILFIYYSMIIGGSTTSLLSLMNNLDPQRYEIDLQLYRNDGPLIDAIPPHVNLLPEAEMHKGSKGRIIKLIKCFFKGYLFKALFAKGKKGALSRAVLGDFQVMELSRRNEKHYDYAIGFLEGWSDKYLAYKVNATRRYAWIHSTFSKISPNATTPEPWMKNIDNIVFVADACKDAFAEQIPDMADKALTIENITDAKIIRGRAEVDDGDEYLTRLKVAECLKLITVCRITISVKGLDRIISVAQEMKKRGIEYLWYIVGDGEDSEELRARISEAGVGDSLIPIGKRINPYPYIKAADLMCMPSRYEGKPMVVTEAMILGTPPIVTEYLSAHEQIRDGEDGIVVPNDDTSVIQVVCRCASEPEKVKAMRDFLLSHEYGNEVYISYIERTLFEEL